MSETTKGCYVFYDPNGGVWEDGSADPKPSPTKDGVLFHHDDFIWPEGTEKITRPGYRIHTSQNYLNVVRFYTADGKGGGLDPENICNGFGYDCWPSNTMEITNNGHDANWFSKEGLRLADGERVTLYLCWDPIVTYDLGNVTVRDFVYKTDGDEYTVLGIGGKTNYARNRVDHNVEGYEGPFEIPATEKELSYWVDKDKNIYIPGREYTILAPLELTAVYK